VAYNASTLAMVKAELAKIVDATTLAAETASLDTFVSSVAKTGADAGVPGQTFTLTDAIGEDVVGTAGNDTYKAVLDGDTDTGDQGTLNLSDAIADIGGTDTLNLVVVDSDATTAQTAALKAGSTIDGVEIVNLLQAGTTLTAVDTDDFGGVKQLWQVDGVSGAAIDVGAGVTIGFRDVAVAAADAVTAKDGVTSLTVALDNVTDNSVINLDETTANDVTTATVTGSVDTAVAGTNRLTLDDTGALGALDTLNVSLTSNTTVTVDANVAANLETLNFGGSTGGLTVTVVKADFDAAGTAVTFGSGNDDVTLTGTAGATANALSITLGAGDDVLTVGAGANLGAAANLADLEDDLVTVTDFAKADDVLDVSALGARNAQNLVDAEISGLAAGATLFDAVDAVAALGGLSVFVFGGATYIFDDTAAGAALNAGDTLIKLTGVAVADLTAANFVV